MITFSHDLFITWFQKDVSDKLGRDRVYTAVTPLHLKARPRKSHVRQFTQNWVGRDYIVVDTGSTWLLWGLRPAIFRKIALKIYVALTGQIYVKVGPKHNT